MTSSKIGIIVKKHNQNYKKILNAPSTNPLMRTFFVSMCLRAWLTYTIKFYEVVLNVRKDLVGSEASSYDSESFDEECEKQSSIKDDLSVVFLNKVKAM